MLCITGDTTHFYDFIKSGFYHFKGLTLQGPSIPLPFNGKKNRTSKRGHFARGGLQVRRVVGVVSVHAHRFFRCFSHTTCSRKTSRFYQSACKFSHQRRFPMYLVSLGGRKRPMAQGGPLRESWVAGLHGQFSVVGALRGWDEQRLGVNDRELHGDTLARADEHVQGVPRGNKDDAGPLVRSDLHSDRTARPTRSASSDDARPVYKAPPPASRYPGTDGAPRPVLSRIVT
jgi:hypothetical protein